jgi:hypothetical protein
MTPNELRIGNYVLYENPHSDRVVVQVKAVDFQLGTHNLHPIPLTEECMVELGLKITKSKSFYFWYSSIFSVEKDTKNFKVYVTGGYCICEIKYVHQLQNLYFALTGQEITITD